MPIKKSLEHVVLPRNPLARIMRYYLYFAQDEAGPSSPIIQIKNHKIVEDKNENSLTPSCLRDRSNINRMSEHGFQRPAELRRGSIPGLLS